MFTGIIEELGEVVDWQPTEDAARITVRAPLAVSDASHGDSLSVSGVCLTVVDQGLDWFTADVMAETIRMSTLTAPRPGDRVNLERAAKIGDRIGGHIVQGHIDGTARVLSVEEGSAWRVVRFSLDPELAGLVVRKGSIALDGVSLTVSAVGREPSGDGGLRAADARATPTGATNAGSTDAGAVGGGHWFEVSLIPETLAITTLGLKGVGDLVNVETDILARQVERLISVRGHADTDPLLDRQDSAPAVTGRGGVGSGVAGSAGIHGHDPRTGSPTTPVTAGSGA